MLRRNKAGKAGGSTPCEGWLCAHRDHGHESWYHQHSGHRLQESAWWPTWYFRLGLLHAIHAFIFQFFSDFKGWFVLNGLPNPLSRGIPLDLLDRMLIISTQPQHWHCLKHPEKTKRCGTWPSTWFIHDFSVELGFTLSAYHGDYSFCLLKRAHWASARTLPVAGIRNGKYARSLTSVQRQVAWHSRWGQKGYHLVTTCYYLITLCLYLEELSVRTININKL